jgi:hypothetical protein
LAECHTLKSNRNRPGKGIASPSKATDGQLQFLLTRGCYPEDVGDTGKAFVNRSATTTLTDCLVLLAVMTVASLVIAYGFDIFPNAAGVPLRPHTIEFDEVVALAALLCVGFFVLCRRFLPSRRREVPRSIEAEHGAPDLLHQNPLTGLHPKFDGGRKVRYWTRSAPKVAIGTPARGAHAEFLLDLNDFKRANDACDGGTVIINVAVRLQRKISEGGMVVLRRR